jgi:hypothetical protein
LSLPRDELQGILDLVAKRFRETGIEYTKQDLVREAVRILLIREKLFPGQAGPESTGTLPAEKSVKKYNGTLRRGAPPLRDSQ